MRALALALLFLAQGNLKAGQATEMEMVPVEVAPEPVETEPAVQMQSLTQLAEAPGLAVICYHRFGPEDGFDNLKLSKEFFGEQLRWLKKNGYQSVNTSQVKRYLEGNKEGIPKRPIMLSIDDGYRSGWTVAGPVLKRYGFSAVYFINSSQVAQSANFLSWKELEAIRDAGHEIGSHTEWHSNLAKPKRGETPLDYAARLKRELFDCKAVLEQRLGLTVTSLAYPFGAFNPRVQAASQEAGYQIAFSVSSGVNVAGDPMFGVRRILVMSPIKTASFRRRVVEKRLQARVEGLKEGMGLYPSDLPREIRMRLPEGWAGKADLRAEIPAAGDDNWLQMTRDKASPEPLWVGTIRKEIPPGFYFIRIEGGEGSGIARDNYLFQIYQEGWTRFFEPMTPVTTTAGAL